MWDEEKRSSVYIVMFFLIRENSRYSVAFVKNRWILDLGDPGATVCGPSASLGGVGVVGNTVNVLGCVLEHQASLMRPSRRADYLLCHNNLAKNQ